MGGTAKTVGGTAQKLRKPEANTLLALKALRPANHGAKVLVGDGLIGKVHVAADDTVSVHVSWRYRIGGKSREIAVGTWTDGRAGMSLKALRDERDRMASALRTGIDPIEQRRAERLQAQADQAQTQADGRQRLLEIAQAERRQQEEARAADLLAQRRVTVRKLFEQWQRAELAPQTLADGTRIGRKDGGEWVRQSFERRVFPDLGDLPVEGVKAADLLAIIDGAKAGGKVRTAQALLADLRQMFRFAEEREIVDRNPLDRVSKTKATGRAMERTRCLSDDEVLTLVKALPQAGMAPRSAAAIWQILATGLRIGECMGAAWAADGLNSPALAKTADTNGAKFGIVDLAARTWHLPTTKNEREHTLHLSEFALARLAELAALRETGLDGQPVAWVFPATDRTRPVCVKSFGKQLADRQRAPEARMSGRSKATLSLQLPGGRWTAHDLRRTAATLMARLGVSTDVIDECLNHKLQSKMARVYIQDRRLADQARAFDALGRRLAELAEGRASDKGNVVALPQRVA